MTVLDGSPRRDRERKDGTWAFTPEFSKWIRPRLQPGRVVSLQPVTSRGLGVMLLEAAAGVARGDIPRVGEGSEGGSARSTFPVHRAGGDA